VCFLSGGIDVEYRVGDRVRIIQKKKATDHDFFEDKGYSVGDTCIVVSIMHSISDIERVYEVQKKGSENSRMLTSELTKAYCIHDCCDEDRKNCPFKELQ
jgi:hypothetical protein